MLVVRSQDKEDLIVDNVMYSVNKINEKEFNITAYVHCHTARYIAKYSSLEKALKVLDMLENKILIESVVDNAIHFQFPQDDEVEV